MKRKKGISVFLVLAAVVVIGILMNAPVKAVAATERRIITSGRCGEKLTWTIDYDPVTMNAALRISGTGEMNNYYTYDSMKPPWTNVYWAWEDEETMEPTQLAHCVVREIVVEEGVTSIGNYAFAYLPAHNMIEKITLADTVVSIGDYAFDYTYEVDSLTIPRDTQYIGNYAFSSDFDKIQVHPKNKYFSHDEHGVLYDKKKTKLIYVPRCYSGAYTIPDTVTVIGKEAFWTTGLTEVTIPDTVKTIEYRVFYNTDLTDVYYGGVESEWEQIEIDWGNGDLNSATIHYTDKIIAVITGQPANQHIPYGETAQFTVSADNVASYQWQYSKDGTSWYKTGLTGYKTKTLSVKMLTGRNNYQYRCKLTSVENVVIYTDPATLTMDADVGIDSMPTDQTALEGSKAQFSVDATDIRSYKWYYRRNAEDSWHTTGMTGYVTNTLTVLATANRNGYQYRCKLTGIDGSVLYTDPATLTITSCIISQPENQCVATGGAAQFTVVAENIASYQWLYRRTADNGWSNTSATGNKTSKLSVPMLVSRNGYQYMCKLTNSDGSILYTDIVTLYLCPTVNQQPQDLTVTAGETAQFTVTADGVVSYQWQYCRSDSDSWSNTSATGNKTDTLSVAAKSGNNGYRYRCKLTGADGTVVYTDPATLTVE